MSDANCYNGQDLRQMFDAATIWLKVKAEEIDSLNVFPVPDGDTGTNMVLTMKAAMEEAAHCPDDSASAVLQAMAWGALMGARGNSGVILAQILRGLAEGLKEKGSFNGNDLAAALAQSSSLAYKAVSQPVEGTILTVIREAVAAAQVRSGCDDSDLLSIMESLVDEARASVARTPFLLPVLRQAGVVDAGGQGLYVLFEGALRHLRGEEALEMALGPRPLAPAIQKQAEESFYGYCTEFLLQGHGLDLEQIRGRLDKLGESVLVVGDETLVRAHLHTMDPGAALSYAASLGVLRQVKVDNMQEQHRDFIAQMERPLQPVAEICIVAVVSGEGLSRVFTDLGAIPIPGGETMNPSVQELLRAVESTPSEKVIILPNNPNVLPIAAQVQSLTGKKVAVVPTKSIPQGVAALLSFNPEVDLETNIKAMENALDTVRDGELTTAMRSMKRGDLAISKGQAIAFLDGDLVVAADAMPEALLKLLAKMDMEDGELVTIYYGADATTAEVEEIARSIGQRYPEHKLELVAGGQPHYNYIVSVE
jgi:DAK2 domain fusion protein YloV